MATRHLHRYDCSARHGSKARDEEDWTLRKGATMLKHEQCPRYVTKHGENVGCCASTRGKAQDEGNVDDGEVKVQWSCQRQVNSPYKYLMSSLLVPVNRPRRPVLSTPAGIGRD